MSRPNTNNFLFSIQQYTTFNFLLLFSFFYSIYVATHIEFYGVKLCEIITRERWSKQWYN